MDVIVANSHAEVNVDFSTITEFSISEAYPNPFNPTTSLSISMPESGDILVQIFNHKGQIVETLLNGYVEAAEHRLTWDASNVTTGIYFVKVNTGSFIETQKLTYIK